MNAQECRERLVRIRELCSVYGEDAGRGSVMLTLTPRGFCVDYATKDGPFYETAEEAMAAASIRIWEDRRKDLGRREENLAKDRELVKTIGLLVPR